MIKIIPYNESQMLVIGESEGKINYRGKDPILNVIAFNNKTAPVLELESSVKKFYFFGSYRNCSEDTNSLRQIHHISVKPEVTSVAAPSRWVLIALCDKLKAELKITLNVFETVVEPTEWVRPLVIVKKSQ